MPTQVTLDRYAEIRAEMETGALRDEVLARAGLSADEWTAAQREWLESMGAEIARGRFELSRRYSEAFVARQSVLATGSAPPAPALASAAPGAPVATGSRAAPEVMRVPAALLGTPNPPIAPNVVVLQPTAPRQSDDVSPWGSDVRGTFQGVLHRGEAFPFNPNAPSSLPTLSVAERLVRVGSDVGATIDAPTAPAGPALPFPAAAELKGPGGFSLQQYAALCVELTAAPGDVEVNEVLRRYQITAEQRKALDEHWQGRIGSDLKVLAAFDRAHKEAVARFAASRGPSLLRTAADPTSSASAPSASPPTKAPPVQRAPEALSATSISVIAPKKSALPFKPQDTAPSDPSSLASTPANMPPVKRAPSALSGTVIGTLMPKGAVLPFGPKASSSSQPDSTDAAPPPPARSTEPQPGGLSLQQYASLCVELATVPRQADETLRRYRITAEQRTVIDAYWQGRMAADPMVRAAFDRAHAEYEAWFVASRGG